MDTRQFAAYPCASRLEHALTHIHTHIWSSLVVWAFPVLLVVKADFCRGRVAFTFLLDICHLVFQNQIHIVSLGPAMNLLQNSTHFFVCKFNGNLCGVCTDMFCLQVCYWRPNLPMFCSNSICVIFCVIFLEMQLCWPTYKHCHLCFGIIVSIFVSFICKIIVKNTSELCCPRR